MVKYMIKNRREGLSPSGKKTEICDVIMAAPEYVTPRIIEGMQGIDVAKAREWVYQMNDWGKNWTPGH